MKSPLTQLGVALTIGLAAVAGYIVWYVIVSHKSAEVTMLDGQIAAANSNVKHIAAARAALGELSGDEAKIQDYFVPESDVVHFITDLQTLGTEQKSDVEVISVSKGGTTAHPTLQLSVTVAGTFAGVMKTIGAIEYAPYDLSLGALSVVQTGKGTWQASLALTVGSVPDTATSTQTL